MAKVDDYRVAKHAAEQAASELRRQESVLSIARDNNERAKNRLAVAAHALAEETASKEPDVGHESAIEAEAQIHEAMGR